MAKPALRIEHLRPDFACLTVEAHNSSWTIKIEIDARKKNGGIGVYVGRDGILCTSTEVGWTEDHENA